MDIECLLKIRLENTSLRYIKKRRESWTDNKRLLFLESVLRCWFCAVKCHEGWLIGLGVVTGG